MIVDILIVFMIALVVINVVITIVMIALLGDINMLIDMTDLVLDTQETICKYLGDINK